MVPSGPQNLGPKLSKSLINNPLRVNKPVAFGTRKQPDKHCPADFQHRKYRVHCRQHSWA